MAAHSFNIKQQEIFFQLFKLLHGDIIAVKAAVYPGITSYGGNFEIGQDAIRLPFISFDENLEEGRRNLRDHFRELVKKRLPQTDIKKVLKYGEALDLLILLSNGNPRMLLQTISKWISSKELSKRSALASSNEYISNELLSYHLGLKIRLPHFASHIDLGMDLLKAHLIPEIQKKNEGKGENPEIQTVYFTIDSNINYKIKKSLSLLEYSGLVSSKSFVKTANRRQAKRYSLHLGIAANDKVFHSSFSRDPDIAIKLLSLTDYREFYSTDRRFADLVENNPYLDSCPNGHIRQNEGDFCPICGAKFQVNDILESLLDDSISKLSLSSFLKNTIKRELNLSTIRDLFQLTELQLQRAQGIGPFRSRIIINSIEEYISG